MALWRVLDLYKHPPNNSLKLGKKTNSKPSGIEAFAAKPLCESPRNSSNGGILSFLFFLFSGINQCLTVNRIENNSTGSNLDCYALVI